MTEVILVESSDEVAHTHASLTNTCWDVMMNKAIEYCNSLDNGIKVWEPLTELQHDDFYKTLRASVNEMRCKNIASATKLTYHGNRGCDLSSKARAAKVAKRKQAKAARKLNRK